MRARFKYNTAICAIACSLASGCSVPLMPLTNGEIDNAAAFNISTVVAAQEPVQGPIDLYEAMARALKYNLDYQVEAVQTSLRVAELDLSHYSLLPNAVANSGYAARNNYSASSSFNLLSGQENFGASTSQEKQIGTSDIQFSWNILDFGLSYVRARQAADKVLIGQELQRKVKQRIIEDVRTAFWRAVSAQRLISKLKALEVRSAKALTTARSISQSRQSSPIASLTYERELVEIRRTTKELERDLIVANSQLAALMNLPPNTNLKLTVPAKRENGWAVKVELDNAIEFAVRNRPELRENLYQQRINVHETHAALLELLPGLELYAGASQDNNRFLLNNDWVSWGAKAGWNLLKVFSLPSKLNVIDTQTDLLQARGKALTMAIMTQVYVSLLRYQHFSDELVMASDFRSVQNRLVEQIRVEAAADRVTEQTLIREEMNALVGEAKYDIANASLQSAMANIYASMGVEGQYGEFDQATSISQIAAALRSGGLEQDQFPFIKQMANVE
jgi:outer membrane protein TolC